MFKRYLLSALVAVIGLVGLGASASAQGVTYHAILNGGNEVDGAGYANAGDPNGYGAAALMLVGTTQICYAILVHLVTVPTAAHIHEKVAGLNGPIVVPLGNIPATGNAGTSSGCATTTTAIIGRIKANPSKFYVNVHTTDKPAGGLRGQLF